jgi:hypothetical protein
MIRFVLALLCKMIWPRRGVPCPDCGATLTITQPFPQRPWETPVLCSCGWAGSCLSLAASTGRRLPASPAASTNIALPLPPASGISYNTGPEGITWSLRRSGKSTGLLPFGIIWLLFTVALSFGIWSGESGTESMPWFVRLIFGGLFPLLGVVMIYIGLRLKYARHQLSLRDGVLSLERELFGFRKIKSLPQSTLQRVEQKVFHTSNYQPVFGIEIAGTDGKLRFGTGLNPDDKTWLEHDLRRALQLPGSAPSAATVDTPALSSAAATPASSPGLSIERSGALLILRLLPRKSALTGLGLAFMAFSILFFVVFQKVSSPAFRTSDAFGWFFHLVQLPFYLVPLLFFVLGWAAWKEGRRLSRTTTVFRAGGFGLEMEKIRPDATTTETWRPDEILRLHLASHGNTNGVPDFHGEIVTPNRVALFGFNSTEADLRTAVHELQTVLRLPSPSRPDDPPFIAG